MSMITIRNLQFQYDAAPEINALYGIDLEIRKGECVILTGESGCGKTTLTRCLNGLIPNFFEGTLTGEILYEGVPVNKLEQYELILQRSKTISLNRWAINIWQKSLQMISSLRW